VIPRPFVTVLVFGLPVLVVAFAILMGEAALIESLGDAPAATVLRWIAAAAVMLLAADALLLVGVLGLESLDDGERPHDDDSA